MTTLIETLEKLTEKRNYWRNQLDEMYKNNEFEINFEISCKKEDMITEIIDQLSNLIIDIDHEISMNTESDYIINSQY